MNHLKDNPVGIDIPIQRIQKKIHDPLNLKWGKVDVYGRAYKKKDSLEVFNGEYEKILYSEDNKIFFIQGNNPDYRQGVVTNNLWICAIVNLEQIVSVDHRGDEEAHKDLISALNTPLSDIQSLEYGMEKFKRVVDDSFEYGNFKFSDIHPYHVFTVKLKVNYSLNEFNC